MEGTGEKVAQTWLVGWWHFDKEGLRDKVVGKFRRGGAQFLRSLSATPFSFNVHTRCVNRQSCCGCSCDAFWGLGLWSHDGNAGSEE